MGAFGLRDKYERLKRGEAVASDGTIYRIPYYAKRNVVLVAQMRVTKELLAVDDTLSGTTTNELNIAPPDMSPVMDNDVTTAARNFLATSDNPSTAAMQGSSPYKSITTQIDSALNVDKPSPVLNKGEFPTTYDGMKNFFGNKTELLPTEKKSINNTLGGNMGGSLSTLETANFSSIMPSNMGSAKAILGQADLNSMNISGSEQAVVNQAADLAFGGGMPSAASLTSLAESGLGGSLGGLGPLGSASSLSSLSNGMNPASLASMAGLSPDLMATAGMLQGANPMEIASLLGDKDKCLQLIKSLEALQGQTNAMALAYKKIKEKVLEEYKKLKAGIIAMADSKYLDPETWADMAMALGEGAGDCSAELMAAAADADISKAYYEGKRRTSLALDMMEGQWEKFWDGTDELQEAIEQPFYRLGSASLGIAKATTSPTKMIQGAKKLCEFSQRLKNIASQTTGMMKSAVGDAAGAVASAAKDACAPAAAKLKDQFDSNFGDASTSLGTAAETAAGEAGQAAQDQLNGQLGDALNEAVGGDITGELSPNGYLGESANDASAAQTWTSEKEYLNYMNGYFDNANSQIPLAPPPSMVTPGTKTVIGEQAYIDKLSKTSFNNEPELNIAPPPSIEETSHTVALAIAPLGQEAQLGASMATMENNKISEQKLFMTGVNPNYLTPGIGTPIPRSVVVPTSNQTEWKNALRENLRELFNAANQTERVLNFYKRIESGR